MVRGCIANIYQPLTAEPLTQVLFEFPNSPFMIPTNKKQKNMSSYATLLEQRGHILITN